MKKLGRNLYWVESKLQNLCFLSYFFVTNGGHEMKFYCQFDHEDVNLLESMYDAWQVMETLGT